MGRIKLIHYHTNTFNAAPPAKNLSLGEIAVNTNKDSVRLYVKDSTENVRPIIPVEFKTVVFSDTDNENSYTPIDDRSTTANKNTLGYISSMVVFKHASNSIATPNFSAGAYSQSLFFGNDDTKSVISMAYEQPYIVFSGNAASEQNQPNWTMGLKGAKWTTYDLSNFTAARTAGKLDLAGVSYNGSSNVTIDKLDCGEF